MPDPYKLHVISRRTCGRVVGSDALVRTAEREGVIRFQRTPTGRDNTTPNDLAALLEFVQERSV